MAARLARRSVWTGLLAALLWAGTASAAKKLEVPPLTQEHRHPSGSFSFRTPDDWTVVSSPGDANALQASGSSMLVRFLFRKGEAGYDSLHGNCMTERLAGMMETDPNIRFEYDFLSGAYGNRRFLDSAFSMRFDQPVLGYREWRQRNLTIVGGGESLCVIAYAPVELWRKSKALRALLDAVVASTAFK